LVYIYSTIKTMHGPINIKCTLLYITIYQPNRVLYTVYLKSQPSFSFNAFLCLLTPSSGRSV